MPKMLLVLCKSQGWPWKQMGVQTNPRSSLWPKELPRITLSLGTEFPELKNAWLTACTLVTRFFRLCRPTGCHLWRPVNNVNLHKLCNSSWLLFPRKCWDLVWPTMANGYACKHHCNSIVVYLLDNTTIKTYTSIQLNRAQSNKNTDNCPERQYSITKLLVNYSKLQDKIRKICFHNASYIGG